MGTSGLLILGSLELLIVGMLMGESVELMEVWASVIGVTFLSTFSSPIWANDCRTLSAMLTDGDRLTVALGASCPASLLSISIALSLTIGSNEEDCMISERMALLESLERAVWRVLESMGLLVRDLM